MLRFADHKYSLGVPHWSLSYLYVSTHTHMRSINSTDTHTRTRTHKINKEPALYICI